MIESENVKKAHYDGIASHDLSNKVRQLNNKNKESTIYKNSIFYKEKIICHQYLNIVNKIPVDTSRNFQQVPVVKGED